MWFNRCSILFLSLFIFALSAGDSGAEFGGRGKSKGGKSSGGLSRGKVAVQKSLRSIELSNRILERIRTKSVVEGREVERILQEEGYFSSDRDLRARVGEELAETVRRLREKNPERAVKMEELVGALEKGTTQGSSAKFVVRVPLPEKATETSAREKRGAVLLDESPMYRRALENLEAVPMTKEQREEVRKDIEELASTTTDSSAPRLFGPKRLNSPIDRENVRTIVSLLAEGGMPASSYGAVLETTQSGLSAAKKSASLEGLRNYLTMLQHAKAVGAETVLRGKARDRLKSINKELAAMEVELRKMSRLDPNYSKKIADLRAKLRERAELLKENINPAKLSESQRRKMRAAERVAMIRWIEELRKSGKIKNADELLAKIRKASCNCKQGRQRMMCVVATHFTKVAAAGASIAASALVVKFFKAAKDGDNKTVQAILSDDAKLQRLEEDFERLEANEQVAQASQPGNPLKPTTHGIGAIPIQ